MRFQFRPEKALEAILYVASKAHTDKYATLKILYLADKLHLSRYGRFISGDHYYALEDGPTPMLSYDIIEQAAGAKKNIQIDTAKSLCVGTSANPHALIPLRGADLGELSDSDIEALDEIINSLRDVPPEKVYSAVWDRVHDGAWRKVWEKSPNTIINVDNIAGQFPNADEIVEYLKQA